jgi:histidine kinase
MPAAPCNDHPPGRTAEIGWLQPSLNLEHSNGYMFTLVKRLRQSLASKLILTVGLTLFLAISTWAFFSIRYQKQKLMNEVIASTDRLTNTIRLGTHYAMMLNSRDDINQIIHNIGKQKAIESIRIYNKEGQIKFSNNTAEVDQITNIKAEACDICHRTTPPLEDVDLQDRTRIMETNSGYRLLGVISPIRNDAGCSTDECHVHPKDKQILGAMDVVVSLEDTDKEILLMEKGITGLALLVFLGTSASIFWFVLKFVNRPIKRLIDGTRTIGQGVYDDSIEVEQDDEMRRLAMAINQMGGAIGEKQSELNRQRDEYQHLFEMVPCLITVQDLDYRLINYNREFAEKFGPKPGDYCYQVYKGRSQKCKICPVEKTFEDGKSHYSEETGYNKGGMATHWIAKSTPIRNAQGDIIAAMELSLDITSRKLLEEKLARSEKKYHAIFSHIPNPVFVLDVNGLEIIDCNDSVHSVYGFERRELIGQSFLDLFLKEDRPQYAFELMAASVINQATHINKTGQSMFVDIRVSPVEFPGQKVLLVTTSDVTKRLEAEQQLIQASKMATLGEMATGVAHELNQPLSVIKTASSFFMKKIRKKEPIKKDILHTMSAEIDSHVNRASKIINHLRQFGRKPDMRLELVNVNDVVERAFEIFSQQLKVRGIEVIRRLEEALPGVMVEADRLEQVFINLLINARDAIEEKWQGIGSAGEPEGPPDKSILLRSWSASGKVFISVEDSGMGIPSEIKDRIFEPFFTTKEVGKGTGLGLSISYSIIKDFRGNITVSDRDGQGARFVIEFPLEKEETLPE